MFQFGKIKTTEKPKQNLEKFDCLLKENYQPGEKYFLFLVDDILHKAYLDLLIKDIEKSGIKSYNIVSAISIKTPKEESTEYLLSVESDWRRYIEFNSKCDAIIAFGSVVRILNKSADVTYYDFIEDKFNKPRYFCGSEFVNGPDCWIYPVASVKDLFPLHHGQNDPTNFLTRIFRERLKRIQKDDLSFKDLDLRDYNIIYVDNKEDTSKYLRELVNADLLAYDSETDGLDFNKNIIGTAQLSTDGINGYIFEWQNIDRRLLKQVLITAKRITGSNLKFDWKFMWKHGISRDINFTDDITLLSHAINSNRSKGLKPGAIFYVGKFVGYDLELDRIRKRLKVENFLQIPKDILIKYAGLDPIVAWRLQVALDKHVKWIDKNIPNEKDSSWTIERWYKEVMIPNAICVTNTEFDGIYFKPEIFDESEKIIKDKIAELKAELVKEWNVPETFKFESTKELGLLFKHMGWPLISESKAGGYATSDAVLNEYELLKLPGIKQLKDLRSYNVALKTFIEGWKKWIIKHPDGTYRIHPSCNTFGTESMRHAMRDPNFQQIPSGSVMAKLIKKLFVTPPNIKDDLIGESSKSEWLMVTGDFASLQFRLALADNGLSKGGVDKIAYEIYDSDTGHKDAHSATTLGTFCKPIHFQIIEIEDEEGNKIIFGEEQKIKIKRLGLIDDNEEIIIKGKEFQADDIFLEHV